MHEQTLEKMRWETRHNESLTYKRRIYFSLFPFESANFIEASKQNEFFYYFYRVFFLIFMNFQKKLYYLSLLKMTMGFWGFGVLGFCIM